LDGPASTSLYNEDWLQDLLFKHPESLPLVEIDTSFSDPIPVVRELSTPVGPLDVLYLTPQGKLVVLEAKLWRNPEARRKVIGQILDYAKELSRWSLEDLERTVSQALRKSTGTTTRLYDLVRHHPAALPESAFNDAIARCLRRGEFMLLIVGDGIQEGAASIAEFLERSGTLHFTFGLVEMAIYRVSGTELMVCPRVLAHTTIVKRTVISLEVPGLVATDPDQPAETGAPEELSEMDIFYRGFWLDLVATMKFDDPAQPLPKPNRVGNIALAMPSGANAWVTLYFLQQRREVGAFLTFSRGSQGDTIYQYLLDDKDAIEKELDLSIDWNSADGKHKIGTSKTFDDLRSSANRGAILSWFADVSNKYVNAFRPRLQRHLAAE
jgi:hypothetical protein